MINPQFQRENDKWRDEIVRRLPVVFRDDALRHHKRTFEADHFKANVELRQLAESLNLPGVGLSVMAPRGAVQDYADTLTRNLQRDFDLKARFHKQQAIAWLVETVIRKGFEFPLDLDKGFTKDELIAAIARVFDPVWWVRKILKMQVRKVEEVARRMGVVGAYREPYVSAWAMSERDAQRTRNRRILEGLVAENDEGQAFTLQQLSDLSTSNPELRRAELMTRMRGFEDVATHLGHAALFLTLTTPSRFHPVLKKKSHPINPKWNGETVQDGQKWLVGIWAKLRAALDRRGVGIYGFRVAEPHHDGTPHWHMLLFCEPKHRGLIELLADNYFRGIRRPRYKMYKSGKRKGQWYIQHTTGSIDPTCDGTEKGAAKYRTECVLIDPEKGSATGYIAKYVAKNIDGFKVEVDLETGQNGNESAKRVDAWAATHSVRQFQQIGGPSVGVWRELRRLDAEDVVDQSTDNMQQGMHFIGLGQASLSEVDQGIWEQQVFEPNLGFQEIHHAADEGDWGLFVEKMGGPLLRRKDRPVHLSKKEDGETQYGEIKKVVAGLVAGVVGAGSLFKDFVTRFYDWSIRRIDNKEASASSWSSVNNCTDYDEQRLTELDYQRGAGGLPAT